MRHAVLFIMICSFAIGIAAILNSVQLRKIFNFGILKTFTWNLISVNVMVFLDLVTLYIYTNIPSLITGTANTITTIFYGIIGLTCHLIMTYTYLIFIRLLFETKPSRKFMIVIYLFLGIIFIQFIAGMILFFIKNDNTFFKIVTNIENFACNGLLLFYTLYLVIYIGKVPESKRQTALKKFGIFYISIYALFLLGVSLFSITGSLFFYSSILLINSAVLIYLRKFLKEYLGEISISTNYITKLEEIAAQYNISPREKEIIELLLKGKINKEIEQELFISSHTVRNHIYHIFQKIGINNRLQLANMIFNHNDKAEK
jgi:DNA-binding CsgD family transcriptional regulator